MNKKLFEKVKDLCKDTGLSEKYLMEKPRDFDPFGQAGFAHLWLQYD